jgi:MYXO-CTERM domain-containing protein
MRAQRWIVACALPVLPALPVAVPLLASSACVPSSSSSTLDAGAASVGQAIINGETCDETVEPTAVAIMLDATFDFGQGAQDATQVMCTGTLIAPDVVLLAAHCLDTTALTFGFGEVTRADFYVTFEADLGRFAENQSSTPLPIPATAIPAKASVVHPDFDIESLGQGTTGTESDIALLFLEVPVTDVVPEVVITAAEAAQLGVGDAVRIAGWGQQTVTNGFFDPPPAGSVGIKQCGDSTITELGTTLLQVGADSSTTRKCHGDSGGPTYIDVDTDGAIARRVIGVTSRAYDQEDCNKGGVDTRVDAFLTFLDNEMSKRCGDGTRAWCDVPGLLAADDVAVLAGLEPGKDDDDQAGGADGDGSDDPTAATGCASSATTTSSSWGPFLAAGVALWGRRRRARDSGGPLR